MKKQKKLKNKGKSTSIKRLSAIFIVLLILGLTVFALVISDGNLNIFERDSKTLTQIRDRNLIGDLRSTDTIDTKDDLTKTYTALTREILIEDDKEILLRMKLTSPYAISGLIASEDTKVAEFLLIDWKDGRTELVEDIKQFNILEDYKSMNREVWFKYGVEKEDCPEGDICTQYVEWIRFETLDELPHKNIKVSMWTSTNIRESVEWVPTINGFEVLQWASYNISEITFIGEFDVSTWANPYAVQVSTDGLHFYTGDNLKDLNSYTCTTPWNVTSGCSHTDETDMETSGMTIATRITGISFNPAGTKVFISENGGHVGSFNLSSPWDISSPTFNSEIDVTTATEIGACVMDNGGQNVYCISEGGYVMQWDCTTAYDIQSCSNSSSIHVGLSVTRGLAIIPDRFFLAKASPGNVSQYNMGTDWEVSSATDPGISVSVNNEVPASVGIAFGDDGTYLYATGTTSDSINQYRMEPDPETIPPAVVIYSPANITYNTPINHTVSAIDNKAMGDGECWGTVDGGASNFSMFNTTSNPSFYNYTAPTVYSAGSYLAEFSCNDSLGNLNNTENISFTVEVATVNIVYPTNNTNWSNINLDVNYTYSFAIECWYSNDSYVKNTSFGSCGENITTIIWSEGNHNVTIWGNDSGGNEDSSRISFTIDTINPDMNITSPINNTNTLDIDLDILFTRSDATLFNCWFSNDTYIKNTTLASCGNITSVTWTDAQHNVTIWVNDSVGNMNTSGVSFIIDSTAPDINITFPINNTNHTNVNVDVLFTRSDKYLQSCWYSNDSYAVNSTPDTTCNNITSAVWSQGLHNVSVWANDTAGNVNVSRISFTIDTINPVVNITSPVNFVSYHRRYTNLTLNFTSSDTNLESCWGSFNGGTSNISLTCGQNLSINITSVNNDTFYFWANDTFGNIGNTTRTWAYNVFQRVATFSDSTMEGATEPFYLNFEQGGGVQTSTVNLVYNITLDSSSFVAMANNVTVLNSLVVPLQDEAQLIYPFYWSITMSDGSVINTTTYNQTVNLLEVDDCTAYSTVLYNYTVFDEELKTNLTNTTIEIQLRLFDSGRTKSVLNFSKKYEETNPARICVNGTNFINANYSATSVVKYTSNDSGNPYAIEYYNILNQTISNTTIPKNIALFDLKEEDSTEFQLTFRDSSLALAPNILVYLYRQYIADNDFKVVEVPLTDTNGQTVLHMVRNDVVYNIVFVDGFGKILTTINKQIAFCEDFTIGQCTLNLNALSDSDTIYDYTDDLGVSYTNPVYSNATKLVSFDFLSNDLSVKTVKTIIVRNNQFGNRTVCQNSLTSTSGTISCNVSSVTSTDRFLFIDIYVDGDLKTQSTIDLEASDTGSFGIVNGAFFGFLLLLFLITMFAHDKQALILCVVFGWAVIVAIGAVNGSLIGALSGGIWLIVTAIIFIMRLKKEEVG